MLLAAVVMSLAACPAPPPSFRIIDLAEAKSAVEAHVLVLVEAAPVLLHGPSAHASDVPKDVGVLVFGIDERSARARAAALARAGNQPVLVFVPRDAEERGRFYAVASPAQEDRRGKDS
ncbi:MAG: hypothetical protein ACRDMZ_14040 [Solirubrobacteraceae bacterium]